MPEPPYYAVIFSSLRRPEPGDGYGETAARMDELAAAQPGFLGAESARGADGFGITVSYWATADDVTAWGRGSGLGNPPGGSRLRVRPPKTDARKSAATARGHGGGHDTVRPFGGAGGGCGSPVANLVAV